MTMFIILAICIGMCQIKILQKIINFFPYQGECFANDLGGTGLLSEEVFYRIVLTVDC
jgi:hypothetical protein